MDPRIPLENAVLANMADYQAPATNSGNTIETGAMNNISPTSIPGKAPSPNPPSNDPNRSSQENMPDIYIVDTIANTIINDVLAVADSSTPNGDTLENGERVSSGIHLEIVGDNSNTMPNTHIGQTAMSDTAAVPTTASAQQDPGATASPDSLQLPMLEGTSDIMMTRTAQHIRQKLINDLQERVDSLASDANEMFHRIDEMAEVHSEFLSQMRNLMSQLPDLNYNPNAQHLQDRFKESEHTNEELREAIESLRGDLYSDGWIQ